MSKTKFLYPLLLLLFVFLACGGKRLSFEELVVQDVTTKMGNGICDSIPVGAKIVDVKIGAIHPIENLGLIDVDVSFNYTINNKKNDYSTALLYSDNGGEKKLEAIGGCRFVGK